ncbi:MAG: cell division protein ZapA [Clostridia bacterium]|nr:cell division protein ZapA [Clostridia bacterium]
MVVSNRVAVTIGGREYIVRGEESPEYISMLASYVDKRMKEIEARSPFLPPGKVAVLAALNIADELKKLEREYETLVQLISEKRKDPV